MGNPTVVAAMITTVGVIIALITQRKLTPSQQLDGAFRRMEIFVAGLEKSYERATGEGDKLRDDLVLAENEIDRLRKVVRETEVKMNIMEKQVERMEVIIIRASHLLRQQGINTDEFDS